MCVCPLWDECNLVRAGVCTVFFLLFQLSLTILLHIFNVYMCVCVCSMLGVCMCVWERESVHD